MEFNSKLFFSALGLAFILEALPYTLFPERMPQRFGPDLNNILSFPFVSSSFHDSRAVFQCFNILRIQNDSEGRGARCHFSSETSLCHLGHNLT